MLLDMVRLFREATDHPIVEPAHMELAEPSIRRAYTRCVAAGARRVVVHPFFLFPGRHWHDDIPRLTAEAAAEHPGVPYLVAAPLGVHSLMVQLMQFRIEQCRDHANGTLDDCELCRGTDLCRWQESSVPS